MNDSKVFFKIVVLNHNKMTFIKKCLDSILSQSFQDFIVVVVDNASDDLSNRLIKCYSKRYKKIKLVNIFHELPLNDAYDKGLQFDVEKFEYVWIINADDELHNNDVLKNIYDEIAANNFPDVLQCNVNCRNNLNHMNTNQNIALQKIFMRYEINFIKCKNIQQFIKYVSISHIHYINNVCCICNDLTTIDFNNILECNTFNGKNKYGKEITIAMATYPDRGDSYVDVVNALLPQCDRFCICFNAYETIPDSCPKSNKIIAICANGKNGIEDLGCNNKMYWIGDFDGYYLTVDDDIIYPNNYVDELVKGIKEYDDEVICSFHGCIYKYDDGKINANHRKIFYCAFNTKSHLDIICHRIGMGVAICNPKRIGLYKNIFLSMPKNSGDDEIVAIYAQKHNIPLICIDINNICIQVKRALSKNTGLSYNKNSIQQRQVFLQNYTPWKLFSISDVVQRPFFRIIIPTWNVEQFIERCITSIISQTFDNYKIIIVDDCSTDDTQQKIINLTNKYKNKIVYQFLDEKLYAGGARNVGMKYFQLASYTTFIDADDYYSDKNVLKRIYDCIIKNDFPDVIKMSYICKYAFTQQKKVHIPNTLKDIMHYHPPWTSCIKTKIAPQFISNRFRFNDVIHALRTYDIMNTCNTIEDACIIHTIGENTNSIAHNNTDKKRISSFYQLIGDVILENFKKHEVIQYVNALIHDKIQHLKNNNFYFSCIDNQIAHKERIIVSMTSWKKRIHNVENVVNKILLNSIIPDKIILNLSTDEFMHKENDLPQSLIELSLHNKIFEIFWVKENTKPYKKIIPTLKRFPNDIIITIDDDIEYPNNFIETLLYYYNMYDKQCPITAGTYKWNNCIFSHYGGFSLTKKEFVGEYLNDLYENLVLKNPNDFPFSDPVITYATLLNNKKYKYTDTMNMSITRKLTHSNANAISKLNTYEYKNAMHKEHMLIQEYILKKYNKSYNDLLKQAITEYDNIFST